MHSEVGAHTHKENGCFRMMSSKSVALCSSILVHRSVFSLFLPVVDQIAYYLIRGMVLIGNRKVGGCMLFGLVRVLYIDNIAPPLFYMNSGS